MHIYIYTYINMVAGLVRAYLIQVMKYKTYCVGNNVII